MLLTDFFASDLFNWVILPLLIALARMVDVSLGTLRHVFISRGMRTVVPVLGFFEVLIWLITMGQIMKNLTNFMCYIGWAGGFAMGTYIGMRIEEKLALGMQVLRIITNQHCETLINELKKMNVGLTIIDGQGTKGPVKLLLTVIERKNAEAVLDTINRIMPGAFISTEDIRTASQGVFPRILPKSKMQLIRQIFPAGKSK